MKIGEWNVNKKGDAFEYFFTFLQKNNNTTEKGPCKLVLLL